MEAIIDKLSEIENAASRIMESAVDETRDQDRQAEERLASFDVQVENDTRKKLDDLRNHLQKQSETELARMKASLEHTLQSMDQRYEQSHEEICDAIYKKIIRM